MSTILTQRINAKARKRSFVTSSSLHAVEISLNIAHSRVSSMQMILMQIKVKIFLENDTEGHNEATNAELTHYACYKNEEPITNTHI